MRQILEGMKDQNWRNVMDDRRSKARRVSSFPYTIIDACTVDRRNG